MFGVSLPFSISFILACIVRRVTHEIVQVIVVVDLYINI